MNSPTSPTSQDRPPQFSMKMLLLGVAGICASLAMFKVIGPLWTTVIVWMALLIGVHVFANAWGTRRKGRRSHQETAADRPEYAGGRPVKFAPTTRLGRKSCMALPILLTILSGATLGGILGVRYLLTLEIHNTGYWGLVIGGCSFTFIGGFLGFMSGTFLFVLLGATFEALRDVNAGGDIRNPNLEIQNNLE